MEPQIEKQYQGLFQHLRHILESDEFVTRHRQKETAFTRRRCLTFVVVVLLLINMIKRSLQDELDEFFRALSGDKIAQRCVSKSAFSQARQKLKYTAFIELNEAQVTYFYDHFEPEKWYDYRLLAIDGSLVDVPDTDVNQQKFGHWGSRHGTGHAKGRVSQLFDVLNQVTVTATLAPIADGERKLAADHLAHVSLGDLLLIDRGYPAFWFFAAILNREADFCARLEVNKWKVARQFIASGAAEAILQLKPGREAKKVCRQLGLPVTPLTLRFIRVELDNGTVECLVTSLLDQVCLPYSLFKELYQQRWPVEEDYKRLKSRLEVENWSGLSPESVFQDFYAALFTKNLAAILAQPVQPVLAVTTTDRKHRYQVNMTNLISKLKDTVVFLFWDNQIRPLLHRLWEQMMRTIEPVRPSRSYPRNHKVRRKRYSMNYKSTR
jgi:hypothetical protein